MHKLLLLLLAGFTPCLPSYSQKILWEKTIGGRYSEYLFDMVPTVDYGFILAGSSLSGSTGVKKEANRGSLDYFIWKMDQEGEEEWQLSFGGSGKDLLQKIVPTGDSGYLLAGTSDSGKSGVKTRDSHGKNDLWLIKINALGVEEWQRTLGGSGDDHLVVAKRLSDGYLIGANTNSPHSGDKKSGSKGGMDLWLLRLDNEGNIIWQQTFGGIYNDKIKNILVTEKGYLVLAESNSPYSEHKLTEQIGGYDVWLIELDPQGRMLRQFAYGDVGDDRANDLLKYGEGYVMTGSIESEDSGSDFWMVQLDKNFAVEKEYTYHFGDEEYLTSTLPKTDDTLLLSGYRADRKTGKKSYIAIEVSLEDGEEHWSREFSTDGDDVLTKVIQTREGGYVFAGNSDGKISKIKRGSQGRHDYWVFKIGSDQKIKHPETIIEAFPNPTEAFTRVVLNHDYKHGQALVSNLNGKILQVIDLKHDMVTIDLSPYPIGLYIVNIKTDVIDNAVKIIKK